MRLAYRVTEHGIDSSPPSSLRLLLGSGLGLSRLLPVASDHDHAQERPHHGRTQEDEDDGDTDGPDAGREEVLERVVVIDKGLETGLARAFWDRAQERRTIRRVQMV